LLYDHAGAGQIFGSLIALHQLFDNRRFAGSIPSCDQVLIASHRSVPFVAPSTPNELQGRHIDSESLTEKLDTSSSTGKLVFHVFAALAEFERNLIRERTLAGVNAARARGRKGGRPRKLQAKELKTIRALLRTAQISVQEIATRFGVSRSTLYRNKVT
jgi:hypothetical protein